MGGVNASTRQLCTSGLVDSTHGEVGQWNDICSGGRRRWGGQCGHGAGGLLAAVVNVGALAVICAEAHEDA